MSMPRCSILKTSRYVVYKGGKGYGEGISYKGCGGCEEGMGYEGDGGCKGGMLNSTQ